MDWISGIQKAVDYVEAHITEDLDYNKIAKQALFLPFPFSAYFQYPVRLYAGRLYPHAPAHSRGK